MYLPPNGGTSSALLETLRVGLVHERHGARGAPLGLELAFATPRPWLDDGKSIRVVRAPTGWGPVSYGIRRHGNAVRMVLDVPPAPELRLRLRIPRHRRLARVDLSGRPLRFDATSGTIRLPAGERGTLRIVASAMEDDAARRDAAAGQGGSAAAGRERDGVVSLEPCAERVR